MYVRLATLFLLVSASVTQAQDLSQLEEQAFREAAASLNSSIVQIQTVGGLDKVGAVRTGTAPTSGVVVSEDGYIISSAFNFASKPASILVILPDGRRLPAKHVADDLSRMLTLIKVEADDLVVPKSYPKDEVRVGQWSIALGRTLSNDFPSVSVGIISAVGRIWGKALQTDAKVSPINYGGPLAATDGRVLGILVPLSSRAEGATAGVEWYDSGIGFAVPMSDVMRSVERLKGGENLKSGVMGVSFGKPAPNNSPAITNVRPTSPAAAAGIESGDVIIAINGQAVSRQSQVKIVAGPLYAGEKVTLRVKRGNEEIEAEFELTDELVAFDSPFLGVLPELIADQDAGGVGIRFVLPDSPAANAGLQKGNRITKINDAEVNDASELLAQVTERSVGDKVKITFTVDGEAKDAEVELTRVTEEIAADVPPAVMEPGEPDPNLDVGRFTVSMEAYENEYWAFVPDDYNAAHDYGLLVWVHPPGDTMEASIMRVWKRVAERRGLILMGPKAKSPRGFNQADSEYIRDCVADLQSKYSIDSDRVAVHGYKMSGLFAYHLAFNERDWVRGIAVASAPARVQIADNDPANRLLIYLHWCSGDGGAEAMQQSVEMLRQKKYPTTSRSVGDSETRYLNQDEVIELGRWIDMLDLI